MGMFRKKPVVIEARQLTPEVCWAQWLKHVPFWEGTTLHISGSYNEGRNELQRGYIQIPTLEGVMTAEIGDWVIRGVKGEFYPCKPDIFAATYDPAPAPSASPGPGSLTEYLSMSDADKMRLLKSKPSAPAEKGEGK